MSILNRKYFLPCVYFKERKLIRAESSRKSNWKSQKLFSFVKMKGNLSGILCMHVRMDGNGVLYALVTIVRRHQDLPLSTRPSVCQSVCLSIRSSHFTVKSLCNQLLLQFSVDVFETLHTCYGPNKAVHVSF